MSPIEVEREADGAYRLSWQLPLAGTVTVHALDRPDPDAPGEHLATTDDTTLRVDSLDPATRHYFRMITADGNSYVAGERRLRLTGAPNLRDFGGYLSATGHTVKWNRLFRAGRLSKLTAADCRIVQQLALRTICDFRRPAEAQAERTDLGNRAAARICHLPIDPGSRSGLMDMFADGSVTAARTVSGMREIYRDLALFQQEAYRRMFELLSETGDGGFLIHCSAGKDRTGFGAALIFASLGVPRAQILADYLLTSTYYPEPGDIERLQNSFPGHGRKPPERDAIVPLLETRREYLESAFAAIDERYSSIEAYLDRQLGVTAAIRRDLAARYLQPIG